MDIVAEIVCVCDMRVPVQKYKFSLCRLMQITKNFIALTEMSEVKSTRFDARFMVVLLINWKSHKMLRRLPCRTPCFIRWEHEDKSNALRSVSLGKLNQFLSIAIPICWLLIAACL